MRAIVMEQLHLDTGRMVYEVMVDDGELYPHIGHYWTREKAEQKAEDMGEISDEQLQEMYKKIRGY